MSVQFLKSNRWIGVRTIGIQICESTASLGREVVDPRKAVCRCVGRLGIDVVFNFEPGLLSLAELHSFSSNRILEEEIVFSN